MRGNLTVLLSAGLIAAAWPAMAQTPAEAYAQGCAVCHRSERSLIRKIPRLPPDQRQAWLTDFMAHHPCEKQDLKPQILEYLMQKTAR